ncbi:MAG: fluoride efflux transporter CrcB [Phycisphaerae bacterium]|nr:fluoride efflux transporter CrcB [Phycisphaerae bacterium]
MRNLALVFVGAGLGGVGRYLLTVAVQTTFVPRTGSNFPFATLVVNVTGCLLIGVLGGALIRAGRDADRPLTLFLLVGILGGYTTFSSFGRETFVLIEERQLGLAALYVAGSNTLGVLAVYVGSMLAPRAA